MDERLHQAKQPVTALAGPYGHPFHPLLVTVPIGAWVASFGFDIALAGRRRGGRVRQGLVLVDRPRPHRRGASPRSSGSSTCSPSRPARRRSAPGSPTWSLNLVVVALFAVSFVIRRRHRRTGRGRRRADRPPAVALALLGASGWLGGKLSFRYGVRVADETMQAEGFDPRRRTAMMDVAALITWVLTAAGGFVMLGVWIANGGLRPPRAGPVASRRRCIFGHFLLAAVGLVLWIAFVFGDDGAGLAWACVRHPAAGGACSASSCCSAGSPAVGPPPGASGRRRAALPGGRGRRPRPPGGDDGRARRCSPLAAA